MIRFLHNHGLRKLEKLRDERHRRRMLTFNHILMIAWLGFLFLGLHTWYLAHSESSVRGISFGLSFLLVSFMGLVTAKSELDLIYLVEFQQKRETDRVAA